MKHSRILIVEDEPAFAMDLREEVEEAGFEVVGIAESADEALIAAETHMPEMALMDISIVGSMDGIKTAQFLREWFGIPCIFITAYSDEATIRRAARQHAFGYLTKPIRPAELRATLGVAIHKAAAESKLRREREEMVSAVDATRAGLLVTSLEGMIRYANEAVAVMTGIPLREITGQPFFRIFALNDNEGEHVDSLTRFADCDAEIFGWQLDSTRGKRITVDITSNVARDLNEKPRGIVWTLRNASERIRHHALVSLRGDESEFANAPQPMALMDASGRIVRVNKAIVEGSGVKPASILGRSLTGLSMDPDPRIARDLMHMLMKDGAVLASATLKAMH